MYDSRLADGSRYLTYCGYRARDRLENSKHDEFLVRIAQSESRATSVLSIEIFEKPIIWNIELELLYCHIDLDRSTHVDRAGLS